MHHRLVAVGEHLQHEQPVAGPVIGDRPDAVALLRAPAQHVGLDPGGVEEQVFVQRQHGIGLRPPRLPFARRDPGQIGGIVEQDPRLPRVRPPAAIVVVAFAFHQIRGRTGAAAGHVADRVFLGNADPVRPVRMDIAVPVFRPHRLGAGKQHGRFAAGGPDPGAALPFVGVLVSGQCPLDPRHLVRCAVVKERHRLKPGAVRGRGTAVVPRPVGEQSRTHARPAAVAEAPRGEPARAGMRARPGLRDLEHVSVGGIVRRGFEEPFPEEIRRSKVGRHRAMRRHRRIGLEMLTPGQMKARPGFGRVEIGDPHPRQFV